MVLLTFDASMKTSEFRIGDWVRLARIPPQVERGEPQFPETHAIFQKSLGGLFRFAALTSMATRNSGCQRAEINMTAKGSLVFPVFRDNVVRGLPAK